MFVKCGIIEVNNYNYGECSLNVVLLRLTILQLCRVFVKCGIIEVNYYNYVECSLNVELLRLTITIMSSVSKMWYYLSTPLFAECKKIS